MNGATPAAPTEVNALAPAPGLVSVTNPDGTVDAVRQEDLQSVMASGSRPATEAEYYSAKTGTLGKVASFGLGAGRGASFGLTDPLLVAGAAAVGGEESGEHMRRALRVSKEMNPGWSMAGEIAGSLAPLAFGAPPAEAAIAGDSALARAGSRIASMAPRAALEGAAIGAGNKLSEDTLGNHATTAEKLIASTTHGALFGLLLGGGLSVGGGYLSDAGQKLLGRTGEVAEKEAGTIYRTASRPAEAAEAGERSLLDVLGQKARSEADEQAFKATGAKIKDFERLGATADQQSERAQRIGALLREEGIVSATASQKDIAKGVDALASKVGSELGAMRKSLEGAAARPEVANVVKRFEEEVMKPRLAMPLGEKEIGPASEYLKEMLAKGGERPTFERLFEFRKHLDGLLERNGEYARIPGMPSKTGSESLRQLRGLVEGEYERAAEVAAAEKGEGFIERYRLGKELYADLATAKKITTREVARGSSNRTISLTDTIAAAAGLATGSPMGLLAPIANHIVRTRGNQIAAHVLDTATKLMGVQRATSMVDGEVQRSVRAFLTNSAKKGSSATPKKLTPEMVNQLRETTRDPQALVQLIAQRLGNAGLDRAAPKVTQALANTAQRLAAYVQQKAPKEPPPTGLSFLPQKPRATGAMERARFEHTVAALNDPLSVMSNMRHISREHVQAVKAVYPGLFKMMQDEIAKQAVELQPKLTTQQEAAINVIFGVPVSPMQQPAIKKSFQDTFAKGSDPTQSTSTAGGQGGPPIERNRSAASGFDQLEASNG